MPPQMQWVKKGLIFSPEGKTEWAAHSALQPTPAYLREGVIRVYSGWRDAEGISRIGYVDLNADDPSQVLAFSRKPCLDIGADGCFDDNGVTPCSVTQQGDNLYLYYAGYQLVKKVRFLVFGGLAVSEDGGETFKRISPVPVVDRSADETLFKVIHTAMYDEGRWKIWYGGGSSFQQGEKKTLPEYDIRYVESKDGIHIPPQGHRIISTSGNEYRIARPNVVKIGGKYHMFLCHGSETDPYSLGYAVSQNGTDWTRNDGFLNLEKTPGEWDSSMMAYPGFVQADDKSYLFYNGNDYGRQGFGYAELTNPQILL